jgi:hypothetical protein
MRLLPLALAFSLAMPPSLAAQSADPEIRKGVKLVDDGEYDAAIVTLEAAVQRLTAGAGASKDRDRGEAYLYLGIAYLAKGHEAAARAHFRDAIARVTDLRLTSDKFSPRVIEAFEKAREDAARTPSAPAPAPAPSAAPAPGEQKKGGKTGLILLGVGGAAAAGIAVAAGGGGSSSSTPSASPTPSGPVRTETFEGVVGGSSEPDYRDYRVVPTRAGTLDATVTWTDRDGVLSIWLFTEAGAMLGTSAPVSNTSARLVLPVENRVYIVQVRRTGGGARLSYTLTATYPQ